MIYPYIVNKNGIWYAAGEDVPENNSKEVEKSTSQTVDKVHDKCRGFFSY